MIRRLALIGCGLMGGSFALALRRAGLVGRVVGHSASASTLQRALERGVIDVVAASAAEAATGADLVLLAVPVAATHDCLRAIAPVLAADSWVMDVGSTKADTVRMAREALDDKLPRFMPAHPIAGKEKAGVLQADATLYEQRWVILTPLPETDAELTARATALWQALGSQVRVMSPERHDATYAAVSHLPHLIAFAAVQALADQPEAPQMLPLAGPGFRDFSRIAASDPAVWRDILLSNRSEVLRQSALFRQALAAFEAAIEAGDGEALRAQIARASAVRAAWSGAAGARAASADHSGTDPTA